MRWTTVLGTAASSAWLLASAAGAESRVSVRPLGGVPAQLAALLARGGDAGSLRLGVAAVPLPAGDAAPALLAVVEIASASLLEGHPGGRLGIELAVYVVATDGRVVTTRHDGVAIDPEAGAELGADGVRYFARLEAPVEGTLRVLAKVHRTGAFALRTLPLGPSPPPFAPAPEGQRWLEAFAPGLEAAQVAALDASGALPHPLAAGLPPAGFAGAPGATAAEPVPAELEPTVAAYREALAALAGGRAAEAVSRLERLEVGVLTADPERGMGLLARADRVLLDRLAARERAALLPVGLAYVELFRVHLKARRIGLARRAAQVAERAFQRFGLYPAPPEDGRLGAAALDILAAEYLLLDAPVRAAALLRQAADLDPERIARWLALTVLAEGDWRLADARRYVERALALQPGNREALLRSARIALAQDETRRATQLFDRLLGSSRPDWVHVVAAQERARIALAQDQGAVAVALLERAAALVPQEPSLWAALAFARHSVGARAGALDAAALATGAQRAFPAAPRHRYLETPTALLIGSRAEVEAGTLLRLDALATALASEEASRA